MMGVRVVRCVAMLFCLLAALPVQAGAAQSDQAIIDSKTWARPRSGTRLVAMPQLAAIMREFEVQPKKALVIYHASGDDGVLWADELRAWLIALGAPSARLVVRAGLAPRDRLILKLEDVESVK